MSVKLDTEEILVLETIPWDKVGLAQTTVERKRTIEGRTDKTR